MYTTKRRYQHIRRSGTTRQWWEMMFCMWLTITIKWVRHWAELLKKEERKTLRNIWKKRGRWKIGMKTKEMNNTRTETQSQKKSESKIYWHVIRMDMDRWIWHVWNITERTRGKTGTKLVVELGKDWLEIGQGGSKRELGCQISTHQPVCWNSWQRVQEQDREAVGRRVKRILKIPGKNRREGRSGWMGSER